MRRNLFCFLSDMKFLSIVDSIFSSSWIESVGVYLSLYRLISLIYLENFSKAWQQFMEDPHVAHASVSMTILDSRTGSVLFERAKDVGLPPASSMKTITAAAALHYLGQDYTYETVLQYSGQIDTKTGFLDGYIYILGEPQDIIHFFSPLFYE